LRYTATTAAGRNLVINGGQDVWQRGTSVASTGLTYTSDRFQTWSIGGAATTTTRQATGDTTNLPSIQYCARVQRNSGQTITSPIAFHSTIETINSIPLAGKTVVISFYARAGSNFSAASNLLTFKVLTGTGTDQNVTGFTGSAEPIVSTATLTTTWQRFQATATLSSSATEVGVQCYYSPTGTASTNDYFEITGWQLELGAIATTFSRTGGNIQGELAACQRYYQRYTSERLYGQVTLGYASSTTLIQFGINPPVIMRVAPTAVDTSTVSLWRAMNYTDALVATALGWVSNGTNSYLRAELTTTGATQYRPYYLGSNNSASAFIGWTAEL
jgi:hypothetical protein